MSVTHYYYVKNIRNKLTGSCAGVFEKYFNKPIEHYNKIEGVKTKPIINKELDYIFIPFVKSRTTDKNRVEYLTDEVYGYKVDTENIAHRLENLNVSNIQGSIKYIPDYKLIKIDELGGTFILMSLYTLDKKYTPRTDNSALKKNN